MTLIKIGTRVTVQQPGSPRDSHMGDVVKFHEVNPLIKVMFSGGGFGWYSGLQLIPITAMTEAELQTILDEETEPDFKDAELVKAAHTQIHNLSLSQHINIEVSGVENTFNNGDKVAGKYAGKDYTGVVNGSAGELFTVILDNPIRPQASPEMTMLRLGEDTCVRYTVALVEIETSTTENTFNDITLSAEQITALEWLENSHLEWESIKEADVENIYLPMVQFGLIDIVGHISKNYRVSMLDEGHAWLKAYEAVEYAQVKTMVSKGVVMAKSERLVVYMSDTQREDAEKLLALLAPKFPELYGDRRNPSMSAMMNWLVQREIERRNLKNIE